MVRNNKMFGLRIITLQQFKTIFPHVYKSVTIFINKLIECYHILIPFQMRLKIMASYNYFYTQRFSLL